MPPGFSGKQAYARLAAHIHALLGHILLALMSIFFLSAALGLTWRD
jgi:hypothetical protein